MPLSRNDILKASDIKTEEVNIPEWGGSVLVRGLSGVERGLYESSLAPKGVDGKSVFDTVYLRIKMLVIVCVDEKGHPLFTEADIEALGKKSAGPIERLFEVASRLSGLSEKDAQVIEENLKNAPKDGLSTA